VLTKCRDWLVCSSCGPITTSVCHRGSRSGHNYRSFGSDLKEYGFFVARIALEGDQCTIFSETTGDRHGMDKINITRAIRAGQHAEAFRVSDDAFGAQRVDLRGLIPSQAPSTSALCWPAAATA